MSALASGAHIEIIERRTSDTQAVPLPLGPSTVVFPNRVLINGEEIFIPEDSRIDISAIAADSPVSVTLTMFVSSLVIKYVADDE